MKEQKTEAAPAKKPSASTYTVDAIVREYRQIFGTKYSPSGIRAALNLSGKEKMTVDEAKSIVNNWMKKEVK